MDYVVVNPILHTSLRVGPSRGTLFFPEETAGIRLCEGDGFSPEAIADCRNPPSLGTGIAAITIASP